MSVLREDGVRIAMCGALIEKCDIVCVHVCVCDRRLAVVTDCLRCLRCTKCHGAVKCAACVHAIAV